MLVNNNIVSKKLISIDHNMLSEDSPYGDQKSDNWEKITRILIKKHPT